MCLLAVERHDRQQNATPRLSALGITRDESSRWQKLAAMPENQFEKKKVAGMKSAMQAKTEGGRPKGSGQHHSKPRQTDAEEQKIALADKGLALPEIAADIGVDGRALPYCNLRRRGVGLAAIPKTSSTWMVFSAAQFRLSVVSYGLPHETTRQARDCDDGAVAFSDSPCRRGSTQLPRAIQML
jgi:hypothetical protein